MRHIFPLLFLLSQAPFCHSQVPGRYESSNAWISLNCDSTFQVVSHLDRDTFHIKGTWREEKKRLLLQADTVRVGREVILNRQSRLLIRDSVLIVPKPSRAEYREMKKFRRFSCLPFAVPSYAVYKAGVVDDFKRVRMYSCQ
ncbi:MAG: hypothetical protein JNM88_20660 [Chitinophagaceae bacterium]|nr:hypothetical protein [Chitinophagaceae bacterium]